ncbi:hypothetical protein E4K72_05695 [Oxalobacteraceae bacterium OM1]|nr:hypothetical protein E4K72_05695 [Oxalobacteraceae bacterium OM1]
MKAILILMATATLAACATTTGSDRSILFNPANTTSTMYVAMSGGQGMAAGSQRSQASGNLSGACLLLA